MKKRTRRALFYSMILIFLLGGTGVVFYAEGWRLDLRTFQADKVGAIYVRSYPVDALINLDGEAVKNKSGFFQTGTLINSLFPQKYTLELRADKFLPWKRTVHVKPSFVTEVKYAVLVPDSGETVLSGPAKNFWIVDDQPVIQNTSSSIILQDQKLPGDSIVGWTSSFDRLLTFDTKAGIYYWHDPVNSTSTNLTALARKSGVRFPQSEIVIDPENTTQVLVRSTSSLAFFDVQRGMLNSIASTTPSTSTVQTISAAASSRFWVAWAVHDKATNSSQVYLYDKFFGTRRAIGSPVHGRTVQIKWANNSILGFFEDDGEFYVYNPSTSQPRHLASDVQDFVFTSNGGQVVTLGQVDLEVFSLRDRDEYWRIHLPQAKRITGIAWYKDGQHLFVSYPGSTGFLELDDEHLENFITLAETNKTFYDENTNEFYYLDRGKLLRMEFPE